MNDSREIFLRDKLENGVLNDYDRDLYQSELDQIEANKQQREAIVTGAADPESSFSLTVDGYTVDFRAEAKNEDSYQRLSIVTQLKVQEIEESKNAIKSSYDSYIRQLELQVSNAHAHNKELEDENADLKNELTTANLNNENMLSDLETAQQDVEAYKKQYEELRNQVSKPIVATNLDNGLLVSAMEKLKASRPAIYNVVEVSGVKSTGVLVETNETIEFHPNYSGKYRVVSYDEAMQIIAERESAAAQELESIPSNDETNEPVSTPLSPPSIPHVDPGHGVVGDSTETESVQDNDGGAVTRAEFEEKLTAMKDEILVLAANMIEKATLGRVA